MAKIYNKNTGAALPIAFTRTNPRPLDESSYFGSLIAAQSYAANDPTAYIGQVLTVVVDGHAKQYKIASVAGALAEIYDSENPPAGSGGGAGSMVTLTSAQVTALIGGTPFQFMVSQGQTVNVTALYVNGLAQESTLYSVSSNALSVSLTSGDPEIIAGDIVQILYSVSES